MDMLVYTYSTLMCFKFQRLFQHTFGTHPEKHLPTGYKGIPFIVGERGIAWGVRYRGVL